MFQTRCWATAAAALVSIGWPGLSLAATLNVPGDFATIQACIDAAVSGVDECVAAPGTYHETINFLGKAITLRSSGGADVTTIDATGIGGSAVTCASGEGLDTVLDGFTITGGTGTYLATVLLFVGGGMYNSGSGPSVTNCTFSGNTAGAGGGMFNAYSSNPTVTNCTFSGNTPGDGGGMVNHFSSPTVTNCTFSGNTALYSGGGMLNVYSNPTVTNCTFSGNTADDGAGMSNYQSNPTVTNCTFEANTAAQGGGGGMYNEFYSNAKVTNCKFSGNAAIWGGGMGNANHSSPTVTNSTFRGNTASNFGGGMHNYPDSNPNVTNCVFNGNTAGMEGGAMFNYLSNGTVTNCIFWGDSPQEVANYSSAPVMRFSDVRLAGGGVVVGVGNINLNPMFVRPPNPGPDGTWDGVDDDYGDLRLRAGSPCIDAGDPGFVAQPGETDLEGHARVLCGLVDMGAYEFGIGDYDCDQIVNLNDFAGWPSCMTGPQGTALADPPVGGPVAPGDPYDVGCEAFDFDGDGDVDLVDFGGFQKVIQP